MFEIVKLDECVDKERVASIVAEWCWAAWSTSLCDELGLDSIDSVATDMLARANDEFVCRVGQHIIGHIGIHINDMPGVYDNQEDVLWIQSLIVKEEWRGRGIGCALMCHAIDYIASTRPDIKKLMLWCEPHLCDYYSKMGWEKKIHFHMTNRVVMDLPMK